MPSILMEGSEAMLGNIFFPLEEQSLAIVMGFMLRSWINVLGHRVRNEPQHPCIHNENQLGFISATEISEANFL